MKYRMLAAVAASLVCAALPAAAQAANAEPKAELDALVARVQEKLRAGEKTSAALAPELAEFAALRERHAESNPAAAARIALLEYSLVRDVLKDNARAAGLQQLLETKYRSHVQGTRLGQELAMQVEMEKVREQQKALIGQRAPDLAFIWSSDPAFKKLSDLRGKVVVLDFWATWCGPCIATFPQIRELAAHYRNADVVVLGVTSIQGSVSGLEPDRINTRGDTAKEFKLTAEFMKQKEMTWPVVFTAERVFNPDFGVRGIPHMAIIAPDGTVRQNGLHPSMPHREKIQMVDALLKEFGKTIPAAAKSQ